MKPPRMFPKVPYTRQQGRFGGVASRNPPLTRHEIARIQKLLLTCRRTATCPRCKEVFAVVRRARYGHKGRESWLVDCATCHRQVVIPVHRDPEPEAPRFTELPLSAPRRVTLGDVVPRIGGAIALTAIVFLGGSTDLVRAEPAAVARIDTTLIVFAEPLEPRIPEVAQIALVAPVATPVVVPNVAPISIPPIDLELGVPARTAQLLSRAPGPSSFDGLAPQGEAPVREVRALHELDGMPQLLAAGPLRYPHDLRMWGVEGAVEVEFVLDTLGRVEPNTIVIVSTAHEAFNAPARDAVLRSIYRPGTLAGRPVRVAVALTLQFALSEYERIL